MQGIHPLRSYRKSRTPKLSQAGLAEQLGVARQTVLRWENYERKIDLPLVAEIERKTGIPAKELRPDLEELVNGNREIEGVV